MKFLRYITIAFVSLLVIFLGVGRSPAQATPALHYTELEFAPPPEIQVPEYTQFELENGIVVYLMEDHELPLVGGTALFHTGERMEPGDQVGLASITGAVMRTGGTLAHPPEALNQLLEDRAAAVETSVDTTAASVSFDALSEDLDTVFDLFADVIRRPAFAQDRIDLLKNQYRGAIARRNDSPDDIADREFQKLIYGEESPYARTVEFATLENISRPAIASFYERYYHPQGMLLGIVGDFDSDTMRSQIESAFGDWQTPPDAVTAIEPTLPEVIQAKQGGVFLVDQPQLTQSYVQLGHLDGTFASPDFPALSVLNDVMNGLGGRLVNQVRSRQGLAYVVYAFWSPRFDYPGIFVGGGQTRSEATVPFIRSILDELETVRQSPVTEDELKRAKDSVLNSFIFSFQTPSQVLSRVLRYDYYDYPADFIFQYQKAVEEVTVEDVLRVAQTYLQPDQIVTLVVGNAAAIDPPLTTLAPGTTVTPIDITIPQIGG